MWEETGDMISMHRTSATRFLYIHQSKNLKAGNARMRRPRMELRIMKVSIQESQGGVHERVVSTSREL